MIGRKLEFNVWGVGVECSKCGSPVRGVLWLDTETMAFSASRGFRVYTDGIICVKCDETAGRRTHGSDLFRRVSRNVVAEAV